MKKEPVDSKFDVSENPSCVALEKLDVSDNLPDPYSLMKQTTVEPLSLTSRQLQTILNQFLEAGVLKIMTNITLPKTPETDQPT